MGNSVVVHLVRHEKTAANLKRQYIGWTDESIVTTDQTFLLHINPQTVYGSDLKRCQETASAYFPNTTYKATKNLRELNFGQFEMKTYEELQNNQVYRNWIDAPTKYTPPEGESFEHFTNRVIACFNEIIKQSGEYVFVIHGGVIRLLISHFGPQKNSFQEIVVNHRTIYTLKWSNIENFSEGKRCEQLLVEPIMVKENL